MAVKIPTFADLGFNDPRASTPGPTYPANDPGAEALGVLGRGVASLGGAITGYAAEQKSKENKINAALAGADLDGNLIRYADAAKNERDPEKLDALKAELPGYLDRAGATITDPEARQLWAATHKIKIVEAEKIAVEQHRKLYNDRFLAGASQQLDEQARLAAQASDPAFREQAQRNIGQIIGSLASAGVISSAKEQELMSGYGEKVIIGTVNWLDANKDPVGAGKYLRDNLRHIDPGKAESLSRHLRPMEDREIGRAAKERYRSGAGGGDAVERFLDMAERDESGGRNIMQTAVGPNGGYNPSTGTVTGPSTAQGHFQITNTTWREFAPKAGVDVAKYPNAMLAPYEMQRQVARTIATTSGVQHWTDYNKTLRANVQRAGLPVSGPIQAAPAVIDENADPALAAAIDAAPPAGEPVPLGQPGVPDVGAWVARIRADPNLNEAQKDIAIAEIQQEQKQVMLGHENAESDLTLAVARGEKGSADIEDAYSAQRISASTRTRLQGHIIEEGKKQALRDQAILRVSAAGAGGAPLDPKSTEDRKALNLHYDAVSAAWPVEETIDRGLAYSKQYGLVPTALQARIRGGLHSGRPELAIEAARTVNRLRNANPQLVGELGDENDLRLAAMISARDSMGVPPERALQMAVEELKVPKAEKEARADDYDAQRGKAPKERSASDTQWIEKQQNSMWVNDPNVDPQMRREFEDVAKAEFQKTGNLEAARRMSLDNINRVWGRSRVGGDNRYMKDAPEKFYGVPALNGGENADWMNEQLLGDLSKNALQDPKAPITVDRIKLLPDPTRGQGGAPVYQVWLAAPDGAWQQVVKADGNPIAWKPDWASSVEFKRRQEGRARSLEEARKLRNPTLAPQEMLGTGAGRLLDDQGGNWSDSPWLR